MLGWWCLPLADKDMGAQTVKSTAWVSEADILSRSECRVSPLTTALCSRHLTVTLKAHVEVYWGCRDIVWNPLYLSQVLEAELKPPGILTLYLLRLHVSLASFVVSRWAFSAPSGHSRVPVFTYHNSSYTEMRTWLCGPESMFLNLIYLAWVRALCLVQLILFAPWYGGGAKVPRKRGREDCRHLQF